VNPEHYQFFVRWKSEDGMFVGRVAEFPSIAVRLPTLVGALVEARIRVAQTISEMEARGEAVPVPFSTRRSAKNAAKLSSAQVYLLCDTIVSPLPREDVNARTLEALRARGLVSVTTKTVRITAAGRKALNGLAGCSSNDA